MKKGLKLLVVLGGLLVIAGCLGEAADPVNGQDGEITFEIIDRSKDEVAAYVHIDHWHGCLPEIDRGDDISLGALILDEQGKEIELDGENYALGVDHAPGAEEGIVSFDLHGDHVHIIGEQTGSSGVVFQLLHGDRIDYETPPIEVRVEYRSD